MAPLTSFVMHSPPEWMQENTEQYGGAGALAMLHGKKNELGVAQEPYSVSLQVRIWGCRRLVRDAMP